MQDVARFSMDALLISSCTSGIPMSRATIDGDLTLSQRAGLPTPSAGIYTPYLNTPLPNIDSPTSLADVLPSALMDASRSRNCK